jgi:hypothetical protein
MAYAIFNFIVYKGYKYVQRGRMGRRNQKGN